MGLAKEMKNAAADKRRLSRQSKYLFDTANPDQGAYEVLQAVEDALILDTLMAVISAGDALMIGTTRDQAALTIGVYEDGVRIVSQVCGRLEQATALLTQILDAAKGA